MEVIKDMYGLTQEGIISHTQLKGNINPLDTNRADTHQVYGIIKIEILNYV